VVHLVAVTSADDGDAPPTPTRCALCDEAEPLTWVELATAGGPPKRVTVCSACYLDLKQRDSDENE
jgi:hypothetical protein